MNNDFAEGFFDKTGLRLEHGGTYKTLDEAVATIREEDSQVRIWVRDKDGILKLLEVVEEQQ